MYSTRPSILKKSERERHNNVAVRIRVLCERKEEAEKRKKSYVDIIHRG